VSVRQEVAELLLVAAFPLEERPDWMAGASTGVQVAGSKVNRVVLLDAEANRPGTADSQGNGKRLADLLGAGDRQVECAQGQSCW
jgi:hypothetical protein